MKRLLLTLIFISLLTSLVSAGANCGLAGCGAPGRSFKAQMQEQKILKKLALTDEQNSALMMIQVKYIGKMDALPDRSDENIAKLNDEMHKEMEEQLAEEQKQAFREYIIFLKNN